MPITILLAKNKKSDSQLTKIDYLFFIENKGQWHNDVLYLCRMSGLDAWITKYGVNYTFYKVEQNKVTEFCTLKNKSEDFENQTLLGHRILFELENSNPNPVREGKKQIETYYNYFIGNDETKHATYVGLYKEAWVKNVYEGIDIRYYFDEGRLRYDFVVQPYADISQIRFKLRGQDKIYTKGETQLCFTTRFGEASLSDLCTYQDNHIIPSKFIRNGETWQFFLSDYDRTKLVVIDPLVYSTYIGGNDFDHGKDIFVDGSGCVYVTGISRSADYDITPGVFQTAFQGEMDVFVTKLNAAGNKIEFSTYIGGERFDESSGIFVDGSGCVYIAGWTYSSNYDVTPGAFQKKSGGYMDVFITKFNATGSSLVYSTYIGGNNDDKGAGMFVDNSGCVYITGYTLSPDYDVTPGAFQTTHGEEEDVFVTKINATGSSLVYSTYIGGGSRDYGTDIFVDNSGCVYITGYTLSLDYDITPGAFQTTNQKYDDVFVTKLNPTGTALIYSTYIGGNNSDKGNAIFVDGSGCAYVTGYTYSTNYDVTQKVFQATSEPHSNIFVTKLNATGSSLVYSTYIGGNNEDVANDIFVDGNGCAYITGYTKSTNYDITTDAFQSKNGGGELEDAFITKLNPTGTALMYSTYIGGSNSDQGNAIFVDSNGCVYITGYTYSTDYDITPGAFQTKSGGDKEIFVTKLKLS
ncbi:MAG: SBBP repeat-containing protein [Bacteroidia bacterium]|nr:SBBP repeat-containing protein [Bacteroidia bacterium]